MSENTSVVTAAGGCTEEKWIIKNWIGMHQLIVAAGASCHVEVGDPKIHLRFFLRSKEKLVTLSHPNLPILSKWYTLCAEILTRVKESASIKVTARVQNGTADLLLKDGTIALNKTMHLVGNVIEVVDRFIYLESTRFDANGLLGQPSTFGTIQGQNDVTIIISAQMFRLTNTDKNIAHTATDTEETEASLAHDLKNMFVAHDNYADLKLESKDHMTLDAHKFILASRSQYMRKCIDDAMKAENFNGTIKMNMNGKPLVTILHWMYTGELHENASNVMEEVVDAAVLFELTHLMKLLDRKVITVCNKENMFRLYQVAQKNGMPNAMDDISAYIRANL